MDFRTKRVDAGRPLADFNQMAQLSPENFVQAESLEHSQSINHNSALSHNLLLRDSSCLARAMRADVAQGIVYLSCLKSREMPFVIRKSYNICKIILCLSLCAR